ncbi:MAG: hypothetical protein ABEJ93_02770 [Candidatus Nanohalobium sp.]
MQKFQILIFAVFAGLMINYMAKAYINRTSKDFTEKQERIIETVKASSLQLSFTVSLYLVLVLTVFNQVLKVSGGVQ